MRQREGGDVATIRAAYQFIARHDKLRPVTQTGAYAKLGALLESAELRAMEQEAAALAAQAATQTARAAREDLVVDHMRPVESIARLLEAEIAELRGLRMPRTDGAVAVLAAHALAMAAEAAKYKQRFVDMGLPETFVEDMTAAVDAFRSASGEPQHQRATRRGAVSGAREALARAKRWLRILDSFVRTEARDDTALLSAWEAVKRYPPRRKAREAIPEAVEASPAPLLLPATTEAVTAIAPVVQGETEKQSARWTLRGLFRT